MSGNPIQFPPNPTVGQLYTFAGATWQWNGTAWVNATAAGAFLPLKGVTDGSNAQAGNVGEFHDGLSSINTLSAGTWLGTVGLALTPGDWDVSATANFTATVNMSSINLNVFSTAGSNTTNVQTSGYVQQTTSPAAMTSGSLASGVTRWNVTANTTLWANVMATFPSGTVTCQSYLRARRVR